jgi:hypothetical protein
MTVVTEELTKDVHSESLKAERGRTWVERVTMVKNGSTR